MSNHTEDVAFAIISAAGDGRAKIAEAIKEARRGNFGAAEEAIRDANKHLLKAHELGNFGAAEEAIRDANKHLLKAHELQTSELLQKEAAGELKDPFNVLVAHAQDYVMTGMAMKVMAEEIVNIYTQLRANHPV